MDTAKAIEILENADLGGVLQAAVETAARALRTKDLVPALVVTVPADEAVEEVQRRVCREIGDRVLVLPETYRWTVEFLPEAVTVVPVEPETPAPPAGSDEAAEKKRIMARLTAFRRERGLGCLEDLAKASRRRDITADLLRTVLTEGGPMGIAQWRAVNRGLDKLEQKKPPQV